MIIPTIVMGSDFLSSGFSLEMVSLLQKDTSYDNYLGQVARHPSGNMVRLPNTPQVRWCNYVGFQTILR